MFCDSGGGLRYPAGLFRLRRGVSFGGSVVGAFVVVVVVVVVGGGVVASVVVGVTVVAVGMIMIKAGVYETKIK